MYLLYQAELKEGAIAVGQKERVGGEMLPTSSISKTLLQRNLNLLCRSISLSHRESLHNYYCLLLARRDTKERLA